MLEYPETFLNSLTVVIGVLAVTIIIWGVFFTYGKLIFYEFIRGKDIKKHAKREELRQKLGSYILLGLEILIAADIISSILNPTLKEISTLGGIVIIRTVISYYLGKELGMDKNN